ncbi:MAG TPA: glycosyltransferase family 4 protein [Polyangiales bacterium]|nr:glycosyltransferase family 4 protein [Polyangiales bacterium]
MRCILTVNYSPWSSYSGGGQRSTHNLARALAARGHEVTVVYTKSPWERLQPMAALPYRIRWATLPAIRATPHAWLRPLSTLFVAREVEALLDRTDTIVHGNGEEAALIPRLRRHTRFGFVMTPRYPWLPNAPAEANAQASWWRRTLPRQLQFKFQLLGRALRHADFVCPTSRYAAGLVERAYGIARDSQRVVPNGVSDEFLHPPPSAANWNAPWGGDPNQSFAIYFGRISREKGVETILEGWRAIGDEPRHLIFAGRGPELAPLRTRVRQLGLVARVHFVTWLDAAELAQLVRRASFAVLPSFEESFGNTMAEAMALGVPVLSTRAGSIPEIVEHDRTGLLVPPGEPTQLGAAMRALASDAALRSRLGAAGQAYATSELSWDATAARFERIYEASLTTH